jgi:hypothetical protein
MNADDPDASKPLNQAELALAIGCGDKLQRVCSADCLQKEFWNADGLQLTDREWEWRDRQAETPSTTQTPSRPQPDSGGWASALGHQLALAAVSAAAAAVSPVKPAGMRESERGAIMAGIVERRPRQDTGSEGQEEAARRSCNDTISQQQQQVQLATSVLGLNLRLLVYAALSYYCMRP